MRDALLIDLGRLAPDPDQPRREFEPEALAELAGSIKARGVLQPILVRWDDAGGRWIILTGERRYRAATMAGLAAVPCVEFKGSLDTTDRLEVQLVENALREDLKPIEQANAYRALLDRRGWSYRDLAGNLHIAVSSVARALALLELPATVQEQVERGELPATTAAELAKAGDAEAIREVAADVIASGLSRSEAVARVRQATRKPAKGSKGRGGRAKPLKTRVFRSALGRLTIELRKAGGRALMLELAREVVRTLEDEGQSGQGTRATEAA
jgi:ParB family chromosome partitioning protein